MTLIFTPDEEEENLNIEDPSFGDTASDISDKDLERPWVEPSDVAREESFESGPSQQSAYLQNQVIGDSSSETSEDTLIRVADKFEEIVPEESQVSIYNPHPMANMMMMGLGKPVPFSGEPGSTPISEFLDTLELTFMMMEGVFNTPARLARAKLLAFQNLLEGRAKQWWYHQARPADKETYEAGAAALQVRFPATNQVQTEQLGKAMAAFNVLKQDGRSVEAYVEHVTKLHAVLGNDFQHLLAMRFVDGIENIGTRQAVDAQVEEPYTLAAVIAAYCKSTKSIRCLESYQDKTPTPTKNDDIFREDPFKEMMRNQERLTAMYLESQNKIMQQVSEVIKATQSGPRKPEENRNQTV